MYQKQLEQIGLSDKEALVYDALSEKGLSQPVGLTETTKLGRTTIYAVLLQLAKKGLVERKMVKNKIHFVVSHPFNLENLLKTREKDLENDQKVLQDMLPNLVSAYNLVSDKPNVRYFEGEEGVKQVLEDSLTTREEILSFADPEAVMTHIKKENNKYVVKREKMGVKKRIIVLDSPFSRQLFSKYYKKVTDTRYIDHQRFPFYTVMMIYDNKISYLVLTGKSKIGVIIEDPNIYKMHRSLFEFVWEKAEEF